MGSVKATTGLLNPMGKGSAAPKKENEPNLGGVQIPMDDEDEDEGDSSRFSNVALSDEEKSVGKPKAPETIFGTIIHTTESAGHVIIGSGQAVGGAIVGTGSAVGGAIIGGIKATTSKLNPMGGSDASKSTEPVMNDQQVEDAFSKIEIDDEPEPEPVEKPKVGIFGQLKATVGLSNDQNSSSNDDPPKESFLDSVKAKTGLAHKDDGIAHNSAPKEGFMGHLKGATNIINPFAGSASEKDTRATSHTAHASSTPSSGSSSGTGNRFVRDPNRSSVTSSTKSSSTSGGLFDSLIGKSEPAPASRPKSEPQKESFLDSILGKPAPPPKEPTMFEKMTGQGASSKKSDGFW